MDIDVPAQLIADQLRRGRVTLFLGPGMNAIGRSAGDTGEHLFLPLGSEVANLLAKEMPDHEDDLFRSFERPDLSRMSRSFEIYFGREALYDFLNGVFSRRTRENPFYTYLADIQAPFLVVSTNYDDQLERALTAAGRPHHVIFTVAHADDEGENLRWKRPAAAQDPLVRLRLS
ncbi:hypothetical protein PHK61_30890 [Actinomycetospora lutea]|uniref:hypothetical protein n=1 Tax=Actinomycetospora lutea TaxID=663604 RepID=UPI0023661A76|nr:hypothetical protein [Actinomycetospora lutea]MDD7942829.1 hypothetical protein [Actinomycetospora lutea]